MKKWSISFSVLFLCVSLSINAQNDAPAEVSEEYQTEVYRMFDLSGASDTYATVIDQITTMFSGQYPEVPLEWWKRFEKEALSEGIDSLKKDIVPVYARYLSLEEIKAINVFYSSPAGKKLAKSTPMITQESMLVGQEWGKRIAEKILSDLEKEGY